MQPRHENAGGFLAPAQKPLEKLSLKKFNLLNRNAKPRGSGYPAVGAEETREPFYDYSM
jgi:hypothetical protein